jgi:putative NIF3 family GTP cyclohydrolase 1 type 2
VHRVGLPWGGLGLFVNVGYQQRLIEQGCDLFIAGEADNYGFRFAAECGIPMIETSHELSENDGLRQFVNTLYGRFPDVQFQFFENECVWEIA